MSATAAATPWKRKGLFYYSYLQIYRGPYRGTVTKRLDFLVYHLVRWIYGEEKLREMSMSFKMSDIEWF